ncbi:NUDIX domain-containing protein [Phenylobacterium terrae]|uniref:NUDIX domain-containing protein n=1 Tax=Phenylobacterium terrae TaxID=2665495 RepID=A0ABW4MW52_9CAUL
MTDPASAPILPAATILVLRDDPGFEVLMVQRHHQIEFASGALVFPGGKTHEGDHDPAWADACLGWDEVEPEQRALRIAAVREVFEEAGLLLGATRPLDPSACELSVRQAVDRGELPFLKVVRDLGEKVDLTALTVFARWITPPLTPKRYDTWFYVARAPADQLALCDGRETVDAVWIAPAEAVRMALAGERKVVFPTRMNLQLLAEAKGAEDAIGRAKARRLVTVRPQVEERPGGRVLTLPTDAGYGEVAEPLSKVMG